jgi:YD repeat-containing protein
VPRLRWTVIALIACIGACSNGERDRLRQTSRGAYDAAGKLVEVTYDRNKNQKIDTWVQMRDGHPVSAVLDTNEDGVADRWEFYDDSGRLTKAGESRANTGRNAPPAAASADAKGEPQNAPSATSEVISRIGRADTWAYFDAAGKLTRIEYLETSNVTDKETVERREFYENDVKVRAEEDADGDGLMDRWETFENGRTKFVEFDEIKPYDGKPDRRFTYDAAGRLVLIESGADGSGRYTKQVLPRGK